MLMGSSYGMEIPVNNPPSIGCMRREDILTTLAIPADVKKDIDELLKTNPTIQERCNITSNVVQEYSLQAIEYADSQRGERTMISPSKKYRIWLPTIMNHTRSNLSSLGYDPFHAPQIEDPAIIKEALDFELTIQNLTRAVAYHLLAQFNRDKETVRTLKSYIYPLDASKPLGDRFYLPVEEVMPPEYTFLFALTPDQKSDFLKNVDLIGFQEAIQYISFAYPDEAHIAVNLKDYTLMLYDLESPNNEGFDSKEKKAFKGKSLFGNLAAAQFNIDNWYDGGRRTFEKILTKNCPDRVDEWNELYKPKESTIK